MADRNLPVPLSLITALCVLVVSSAFAAQPSRRALQDLAELQALLVGRFDTGAQATADAEGTARVAIERAVLPVRAGFIGDTVFYVQESALGDARRVLSQQLLLLEALPGSALLVTSPLGFNEPLRWREGARSPEVFRSILPQDVKAVAGCEVIWKRVVDGFDGATDAARCRHSVEGNVLRIEQRYQLRAAGLSVQELRFDESGQRVSDDPPLQFRRQAP